MISGAGITSLRATIIRTFNQIYIKNHDSHANLPIPRHKYTITACYSIQNVQSCIMLRTVTGNADPLT